MKNKILSIVIIFALGVISPAKAENTEVKTTVVQTKNLVQVGAFAELYRKNWQFAQKGTVLLAGQKIRTGLRSAVEISYPDGTTTRIGSRSLITINEGQVNLKKGFLWGKVNKLSSKGFKIFTANAIASILGTEFFTEVSPDGSTLLTVLEGKVTLSGKKGEIAVSGGQKAIIDRQGKIFGPDSLDLSETLKRYDDVVNF